MAIITTYSQFRTSFAIDLVVAKDGYLRWPVEVLGPLFVGLTRPTVFSLPFTIHAVGVLSPDDTPGIDDYNWYLSQRTDDPTKQVLSITQQPPSGGNTYSGTVIIDRTALGISRYPGNSEASLVGLFRHVDLYVQDKNTFAPEIQHVRFLDSLLGQVA